MLKMSFHNGTLDRDSVKSFIESTTKPIVLTVGFKWKNPRTLMKPISKEKALNIVEKDMWIDVDERSNELEITQYSQNDMW